MKRREFVTHSCGAGFSLLMGSCASISETKMASTKTTPKPHIPQPIRPGDTVGCICPGSPVKAELIGPSVAYLETRGYRVKLGKHLTEEYLCGMSGTDRQRLEDLNGFIRDPEIRAIFALRGGYGTHRLLKGVDYDALKNDPKWIAGYSDVTSLHLAIYLKTGLPSLHGPVIAYDFGERNPTAFLEKSWWDALNGNPLHQDASFVRDDDWEAQGLPREEKLEAWVSGRGEGVALGGNLSRLASLAGTPFALPNDQDCILFLEEVEEAAYRVDRFITQLRESGAFQSVRGIMVGDHIAPEDEPEEAPMIREVLRDRLADLGVPVLFGVPIGHHRYNMTVVHGAKAVLDADKKTLRYA